MKRTLTISFCLVVLLLAGSSFLTGRRAVYTPIPASGLTQLL